jgi:tetratricopeptide (TPR) repeat protein
MGIANPAQEVMMIQRASCDHLPPFLPWLLLMFLLYAGCGHKSVEDYLRAGDQAMQSDRLSEAESDYQQAAQIAPNDARPHLVLADLYILELKAPQAEAEATKALQLDPKGPRTHATLATAYRAQSKFGPAEAQGRAAVALAPADAEYRLNLGATLQSEQKLGDAEAEYLTAEGLEPRNAHTHLALATLFTSEPNRQSDAQAEFAQVKALDPSLMPANVQSVAAPSAVGTPAATNTKPKAPTIEETDQLFLLTHDSPVYDSTSDNARVIAQVHRRRNVHVTGISASWLRIQLSNGTVGYIPVTAAE